MFSMRVRTSLLRASSNGGGTTATPYDPRNNTALHILLTTDTSTYTGAAPSGTDHPIAWCHRYDGGRSVYTAMGHTIASYREPLFVAHLLGAIEMAAGRGPFACGQPPSANRRSASDAAARRASPTSSPA